MSALRGNLSAHIFLAKSIHAPLFRGADNRGRNSLHFLEAVLFECPVLMTMIVNGSEDTGPGRMSDKPEVSNAHLNPWSHAFNVKKSLHLE